MSQPPNVPGADSPGPPMRRADVTVHELDGEALIFHAGTGDTHWLNETALFIWRQCQGQQDVRQMAELLSKTYDISAESALAHVERVLRELQERQLIVTND